MPSKYSHSVVLATYSSRGIISISQNQQKDHSNDLSQSQQALRTVDVSKSPHVTTLSTENGGQCKGTTTVQRPSSSYTPRTADNYEVINHSSKDLTRVDSSSTLGDGPSSYGNQLNEGHHSPPPSFYDASSRPASRLTAPYDPYDDRLDVVHRPSSLISSNPRPKTIVRRNTERVNTAYGRQTIRPASVAQERPRGRQPPPVKPAANSSSGTMGQHKHLLSLQQFLNASPRIGTPIQDPSPSKRPMASISARSLGASPNLDSTDIEAAELKRGRAPRPRNSSTSFIDSSEDEKRNRRSGVRTSRSVSSDSTNKTSASEVNFKRDTRPLISKKELAPIRLDLTKELPPIPDDASLVAQRNGEHKHKSSIGITPSIHSRQWSEDLEDSSDALPLQKHSPVRRPRVSPISVSTTVLRHHPASSIDEGEPGPAIKTESPKSITRQTISQMAGHESSSMTDGEDADVEESGPEVSVHPYRRYYRAIDEEIPTNETRPRISPANSYSSRSPKESRPSFSPTNSYSGRPSKESRPRISPTNSYSGRSSKVSRPRVSPTNSYPGQSSESQDSINTSPRLRSESAPPRIRNEESPNILTDADRLKDRPVNPMPNFGVPSIVRSPGKGVTPLTLNQKQIVTSPTRSKQMRSPKLKQHTQVSPLPRITEASTETIPTDSRTWKLPVLQRPNSADASHEVFTTDDESPASPPNIPRSRNVPTTTTPPTQRQLSRPLTSTFRNAPYSFSTTSGLLLPPRLHVHDYSASDYSDQDEIACPPDIARYKHVEPITPTATHGLNTTKFLTKPKPKPLSKAIIDKYTVRDEIHGDNEDEDEDEDNDDNSPNGMQTLIHALRTGPDTRGEEARRQAQLARLDDIIRQTEAERKKKRGRVFSRLLGR